MNERQKDTTEAYLNNYDAIFKKKIQPEPTRPVRPTSEESSNGLDEDEMGIEMYPKP
jgi:hypothetical protein